MSSSFLQLPGFKEHVTELAEKSTENADILQLLIGLQKWNHKNMQLSQQNYCRHF